jgi:hypothetical protein
MSTLLWPFIIRSGSCHRQVHRRVDLTQGNYTSIRPRQPKLACLELGETTTVATPRGPDFLVVGAQRAGTTWMHRLLRQHPALWLPSVKELHYFDKPQTRRTWDDKKRRVPILKSTRYGLGPWYFKYLLGLRNDQWYAQLFHKAQERGQIAGEVTPAYATLDEGVFRRIWRMNNDVKLAFVMRDPVERAWSAVNNDRMKGRMETPFTIDSALARALAPSAATRSAYTETIRRLENVFLRQQLCFCFFDDIRDRPKEFSTDLLSFLGACPGDLRQMPPRAVNVVVGSRPVPRAFERRMAEVYLPMVRELCERFDGPPHAWRARYEKLINGPDR